MKKIFFILLFLCFISSSIFSQELDRNIGNDVRNDIQLREQWVERLKECEEFYINYTKEIPPSYLVYSTSIRQGEVNYQNKTVSLSLNIYFYPHDSWYTTLDQAVKTVRNELIATGRAQAWGLDKWPEEGITSPNPFFWRLDGYTAEIEILNDEGERIADRVTFAIPICWTVELPNARTRQEGNFARPVYGAAQIDFPAANVDLITDNLSINIPSIDGQSAQIVAQEKNISIMSYSEYTRISNPDNNWKYSQSGHLRSNYATIWQLFGNRNDLVRSAEGRLCIIWYGMTSITSDHGFGVRGLSAVFFPSTVTSIGQGAFNANNLNSVTIPNTVRTIAKDAFSRNLYLTRITIGANVNIAESSPVAFGGDDYGNPYWFFPRFYTGNNRRAGTYICTDRHRGTWTYIP